jgi:hypothetical protein
MSTNELEETLKALETYWRARPYLRLGQILYNAWKIQPKAESDVFYMSDNTFVKGLQLLSENGNNEPKG